MKNCRHGIGEGYACIDRGCVACHNPKAQRVLEAARAWRKDTDRWVADGAGRTLIGSGIELRDAIDALDAPRERFVVTSDKYHKGQVNIIDRRDGIEQCVAFFPVATNNDGGSLYRTEEQWAEKIAAALNAADARELVVSRPGESRDAFEKRLKP